MHSHSIFGCFPNALTRKIEGGTYSVLLCFQAYQVYIANSRLMTFRLCLQVRVSVESLDASNPLVVVPKGTPFPGAADSKTVQIDAANPEEVRFSFSAASLGTANLTFTAVGLGSTNAADRVTVSILDDPMLQNSVYLYASKYLYRAVTARRRVSFIGEVPLLPLP